MWLKKLKKKKLQCFLIGVLLFLSSLIFSSSMSIITSVNSYVSKYYANDKYYNAIIFGANKNYRKDVSRWCANSSKVKEIKFVDTLSSGNNLYHNGQKLKISNYNLVPLEDYKDVPFGLTKNKYLNGSNHPGKGEIWISKLSADSYQISLGDNLKFKINDKTINLKVTSIVNDSLQPSATVGEIIFYTSKENNEDFDSFVKLDSVFINTKKYVKTSELEKSLTSNTNINGLAFDKDTLIDSATMISSILGGVTGFAALLVFGVSVFIIRFIIWNNILKEYKSIGIYKALGFSKKQIFKFYILGYSLIVFIGSILGALSSIPVLNYTGASFLKYIGDFKGVDINFKIILLTAILFSLIVIMNLYFVIKRTDKISPVKAITTGITSSRKKLKKSFIKNSSSPLVLAINDIFKYKKTAVYMTISLVFALSLMMIFGNLGLTLSKMQENINLWFGMPKSSVTISFDNTTTDKKLKDVLHEIKSDKRVKNYCYGSQMEASVKLDTYKYHIKSSLYGITDINSYNDNMKFSIADGHNPVAANEVCVSKSILKDSNLSVGDYIELTVNDKKVNYLISGSFYTMQNDGYNIRILNSEIKKKSNDYGNYMIYVNLKDNYSASKFEKDINKKFLYVDANDISPIMKYGIESVPSISLPIIYVLLVSFIIFAVIIVFNILIMNIRDNRKNFGIMKALGFSSREIKNRYLFRIVILTVASSIISIVFNCIFSKSIIKIAMGGLNVLIISPVIITALVISMFALIILIVFACSHSINNTKPNELMEE